MARQMIEINLEAAQVKYQAELESYVRALQELEAQKAQLIQAIAERRGILIYLNSLDSQKNSES